MDTIVEHFKLFYMYYIFGAIVVLPLMYFTRRWSVPILLYAIEIIIYWGLMHVAVYVMVHLAAWFKDESSMDRAFSRSSAETEWSTPLVNFWDIEAYIPTWLFWFEIVVAVVIFGLVWRYRPMKTGHPHRKKKAEAARKAAAAKQKGLAASGRPNYKDDY